MDTTLIWQLECRNGKEVIYDWPQIYEVISNDSSAITYDKELFQLTTYGLVLLNNETTERYPVVTYQNHHCIIDLN